MRLSMTLTPSRSYRPPKNNYKRAAVQPPGERHCPACGDQLWLREGEGGNQYARRTYCNLKCSRKGVNRQVVVPRADLAALDRAP